MEGINSLQHERDNLRKTLPDSKDFQNPEKIQTMIEDMQRRYETTTLKPQEEKKILADIKKLKDGIPNAQRLIDLKPKIDELYDQRNSINEELNKLRPLINAKHEEIDKISKELDEAKEQREDIKSQLDKFEEDIAKIKEDIAKLVENKQQIKEEYYQAKFDYEVEKDAITYLDWI
jgi:uncharacterized coiled-coil DUF342 family protein